MTNTTENMSKQHSTDTPYGPVNPKVLEELESSFDTQRILDAAQAIDNLRWLSEPEALRTELLKIYDMARVVIDGDSASHSSTEPIWEIAESLSFELSDVLDFLEKTVSNLDELARLIPEVDWESDEDDDSEI